MIVIPAKAGIQGTRTPKQWDTWAPAFAGATG